MAGETSLLSRHFALREPDEKVSASNQSKCFDFKCEIVGFKRKQNLWENHVLKGNLQMFPLLLGFESGEGYHQVS
jgi:hypothetical protein